MANKILSLYPRINRDILMDTGCKTSRYQFSYSDNGITYPLECNSFEEGLYEIDDPRGLWNADEYSLSVRQIISVKDPSRLFGPGGIACASSVLTAAIVWKSADSRQRGIIRLGDIVNSSQPCELSGSSTFAKGSLRGNITFETQLFIKKPGTPSRDEEKFANLSGISLGQLHDVVDLVIDGSASVFPIFEVDMPGEPLWEVRCDWTDPVYDKFSESVTIYLNRSHPSYKYITRTDQAHFSPDLLNEIMSSAITQVIMTLKENDELDPCLKSPGEVRGSVAEAVNYFVTTLEFDITSSISLSKSIRKFMDEGMK